jgi:tetratricopeptide (TPR) repeat protein
VESVLAQTYRDFEYVIQDGSSTDGTLRILREYDDPRIVLRSEPDASPADAFWKTVRRCRGEYVAACRSDEEWRPHAIEEGVAALDSEPRAVALTRDADLTDVDGSSLGATGAGDGRPFDIINYMANRFAPNFAAAMFRRQALEAVGLHTRAWHPDCGEFELWCRLALLGPIAYRAGVVAKYAIHEGQLSRDASNAVNITLGRLAIIDQLAGETGLFTGRPDLWRACRVATTTSFANRLATLGAHEYAVGLQAVDLFVAAGDESGRLLPPMAPHAIGSGYVGMARSQLLAGQERLALDIFEVATHLISVDARTRYDMGRSYAAAGYTNKALEMYDSAIALAPDLHDAHWERGVLLEARGRIEEALEAWRHVDLEHDPRRHSLALVASLKSPRSTNSSLLAAHREWARHHAQWPIAGGRPLPGWRPGDRVTVAYACSFWDADTITFQLLPLLRRHDRRRFKVIAYAHGEPGPLVKAAVDEVRIVGGLSNEDYVRRVREDGVHILVEINGHSPGHWFAAMAARCAPIQISYLNYTSTCGIKEVDYVIGDAISIPAGMDRYFTEQVYRLPGCFFCFTYEDAVLPPVGAPPSIASGTVTFGCFGSGGKINPPLLDLWAEILRRAPASRLFIRNAELTPADNRQALVRAFERRGIDRARLLILPGTTRQGVLESYAKVDLSLDTFPYCGGNTIAESLWQGVPVVTLKGDRFSSAYGASLLTASGVPELVADTPEQYVQKAVALAGDPDRLTFYRANLRTYVRQFGFSDADQFTAGFEAAYLDMLARKYQGAPTREREDVLLLQER